MDDDTRRRFKEIATQRFALFLEGVDKGQFGTLILTTDGERYRVTDIAHPLPERYLEQWEEDRLRFDADFSM